MSLQNDSSVILSQYELLIYPPDQEELIQMISLSRTCTYQCLTLQHQVILEPAMVHPGPQPPGQDKMKAAGHTQRMEE